VSHLSVDSHAGIIANSYFNYVTSPLVGLMAAMEMASRGVIVLFNVPRATALFRSW